MKNNYRNFTANNSSKKENISLDERISNLKKMYKGSNSQETNINSKKENFENENRYAEVNNNNKELKYVVINKLDGILLDDIQYENNDYLDEKKEVKLNSKFKKSDVLDQISFTNKYNKYHWENYNTKNPSLKKVEYNKEDLDNINVVPYYVNKDKTSLTSESKLDKKDNLKTKQNISAQKSVRTMSNPTSLNDIINSVKRNKEVLHDGQLELSSDKYMDVDKLSLEDKLRLYKAANDPNNPDHLLYKKMMQQKLKSNNLIANVKDNLAKFKKEN